MALALAALVIAFPGRLALSLLFVDVPVVRRVRQGYSVNLRLTAKGFDYATQITEVRFLVIDKDDEEPRRTLYIVPKDRLLPPFKVASGHSVRKTISFRHPGKFPRNLAIKYDITGTSVFSTQGLGSTERVSVSPARRRK